MSSTPTEASALQDISLSINEIFVSIQGESTRIGLPCVFLRTSGCPLRCRWCDTEYAFYEGSRWQLDALVQEACSHGVDLVEITGGEPLAQPGTPALASALLERGKTVLVETSGSFDISVLPQGAHSIMDLKCPSSGEQGQNDLANIDRFFTDSRMFATWASSHTRPVLLTSFALNFAAGDTATGFKIGNLAIHCLNIVLLFLFLLQVLRRWELGRDAQRWSVHRSLWSVNPGEGIGDGGA